MHGLNFKLLFFALLLAGCQTATPGIKVEYVDRPVIVQKACLEAKDVPTKPARLGAAPSNIEVALSTAMAKVSEWMRYGNRADPIMKSCSE